MPFYRVTVVTGFLAVLIGLFSPETYAIQITGLYETEVPVADQSVDSRKRAVTAALRGVLVKLTGDRNAPARPVLAPVLEDAQRYLLQFRYRESSSTSGTRSMNLWVQFDEKALNDIMRNYGIPLWGMERPSILVWLASQGPGGRRYVNPEEEGDYLQVLEKRAQSRGVALIFPLYDLEDRANLKTSDIWGGFREPVIQASGRYHADAILTGIIGEVNPSVWEGSWTVYLDELATNWTTEGDLAEVVLDEGIDGLVDMLASRYANIGGSVQESTVDITVSDIFNLDQYAHTLKYLETLNSVLRVNVKRVETGNVTFQVTVHGGVTAITQAIALGRTLESISTDGYAYRLMPK